jgi:hypothetical protein
MTAIIFDDIQLVPGARAGKPGSFTMQSRACHRLHLYSAAMSSMVSSSSVMAGRLIALFTFCISC